MTIPLRFLRAHTFASLCDYITNTKANGDVPPIAVSSRMQPSENGLLKNDPSDTKP